MQRHGELYKFAVIINLTAETYRYASRFCLSAYSNFNCQTTTTGSEMKILILQREHRLFMTIHKLC